MEGIGTMETNSRQVLSLLEKIKSSKGRKLNKTYKKERPEGEYLYAPPKVKKRKRTESVEEEAMRPENQRLITDIVPSPKAVEAAKSA